MARIVPGAGYLDQIILCDTDATIFLPNPNLAGGPLQYGASFTVIDNLGRAGTTNIAIRGPVKSLTSTTSATSLTAAYQQTILRWGGSAFSQSTPS